ncbi:MAG: arsenite methyltransferase [Candidatus Latescibacteria bacterium]|nr:arsenite methyltransferase [Candidatus Latescibacterota bacterium]
MANIHDDNQRTLVREAYSRIAQSGGSCCGGSSCCGTSQPQNLAETIGYSSEELIDVPDSANMGLSCGNPTAIASLLTGDTVLDLGCGGGFDVFIAARKVGSAGRCIGVDMTPDMIDRARKNAESFKEGTGLANVEFRLGEIEHLPVADSTVDVVISNCVINLSNDKPQVWKEISRVLKPGGRACISDLALIQPLPDSVKNSIEALVGCVAGAVLIDDTEKMVWDSGLTIVSIEKHSEYIESMTEMQDPLYQQIIELLPEGTRISDFITSVTISGKKFK